MTSQQRMAQVFSKENFDDFKKNAPEVISIVFCYLFSGNLL